MSGTSVASPGRQAVCEDEAAASARWNAHSEFKRDPSEIRQRWSEQNPRFPDCLRELIRKHPGCIMVTFEPSRGFTWHPEHRAVGLSVSHLRHPHEPGVRRNLDAAFYWVLHPDQRQDGDELIDVNALSSQHHQDYVETALRAQSMHETQYGKRGTDKSKAYLAGFRDVIERITLRPVTEQDAN